ncbi:7712_t:CDS:2, partial [Paraglomus occultum]
MAYLLPNNKEERKTIQKSIIDKYIKRLPGTQIVVMGDFNIIVNVSLNRPLSQRKKQIKLDPLLERGSKSRIDYIWITEELANGLRDAKVQEIDTCTNSDHKAVIAKIDLSHLITPYSATEIKRKNYKRT